MSLTSYRAAPSRVKDAYLAVRGMYEPQPPKATPKKHYFLQLCAASAQLRNTLFTQIFILETLSKPRSGSLTP